MIAALLSGLGDMTSPELERPIPPAAGLGSLTARIVVCKLCTALAYMGIAALTARQLGPSGRGVLVLLLTLAAFGLLVCSMGIDVGGRVLLVAPDDPVAFPAYFSLSLLVAVLQFFVCLALALTVLPLVDVHLSGADTVLFALLGTGLLLQKLFNECLVAYGLTVMAAMTEAASFVGLLGIVAALAVTGHHDVRPFVIAFVVQASLQTLASLVCLRGTTSLRPHREAGSWSRLIRTGFPGIGFGFSQLLAFRLDRYLIALFVSPAAVGIYSVAATAPEFLRMAPMALGQNVVHRLASGAATEADFRRARKLCLIMTLGLGGAIFVIAPYAVEVVFGRRFVGAVTPLRILLLAEIGMTIFSIDGAMLLGRGWVRDVAIASTTGLVLVAVLDLMVIPRYGLAGAAWASVLAYSSMGAAAYGLLRRRTRMRT